MDPHQKPHPPTNAPSSRPWTAWRRTRCRVHSRRHSRRRAVAAKFWWVGLGTRGVKSNKPEGHGGIHIHTQHTNTRAHRPVLLPLVGVAVGDGLVLVVLVAVALLVVAMALWCWMYWMRQWPGALARKTPRSTQRTRGFERTLPSFSQSLAHLPPYSESWSPWSLFLPWPCFLWSPWPCG